MKKSLTNEKNPPLFVQFLYSWALVFILIGCVSTIGQTPGQKFYGALADYEVMQQAAIAYKDNCELHRTPGCDEVVVKIQEVNNKADGFIKTTRLEGGSGDYVDASRLVLLALTNELRTHLQGVANEQ